MADLDINKSDNISFAFNSGKITELVPEEVQAGVEKMSFAASSNQSAIEALEAKLTASANDCQEKTASLNTGLATKESDLAAKEADWNLKIQEL